MCCIFAITEPNSQLIYLDSSELRYNTPKRCGASQIDNFSSMFGRKRLKRGKRRLEIENILGFPVSPSLLTPVPLSHFIKGIKYVEWPTLTGTQPRTVPGVLGAVP